MGGIIQPQTSLLLLEQSGLSAQQLKHLKILRLPTEFLLRLQELFSGCRTPMLDGHPHSHNRRSKAEHEQIVQQNSLISIEKVFTNCGIDDNYFSRRLFCVARGEHARLDLPDITFYEFIICYWDICSVPIEQLALFLFHMHSKQDHHHRECSDSDDPRDTCLLDASHSPRPDRDQHCAPASIDVQKVRMSAGEVRYMLLDIYGGSVSGVPSAAREAVYLAGKQREDFTFTGASFARHVSRHQKESCDENAPSPSSHSSKGENIHSVYLTPILRVQKQLREACLGEEHWKQHTSHRQRLSTSSGFSPLNSILCRHVGSEIDTSRLLRRPHIKQMAVETSRGDSQATSIVTEFCEPSSCSPTSSSRCGIAGDAPMNGADFMMRGMVRIDDVLDDTRQPGHDGSQTNRSRRNEASPIDRINCDDHLPSPCRLGDEVQQLRQSHDSGSHSPVSSPSLVRLFGHSLFPGSPQATSPHSPSLRSVCSVNSGASGRLKLTKHQSDRLSHCGVKDSGGQKTEFDEGEFVESDEIMDVTDLDE